MSYNLIENEKNLNLMFQALKSGKKKKSFTKSPVNTPDICQSIDLHQATSVLLISQINGRV